jgi:hypothetical protein
MAENWPVPAGLHTSPPQLPVEGGFACRQENRVMATPVESALRRAVADLNALKVQWALIGGLAISVRSVPRFTAPAANGPGCNRRPSDRPEGASGAQPGPHRP